VNAPGPHKAGYVALAGAPNAGKSTLLNALVHEKLAAVTPKPQTTRRRTLGILSRPDCQIILLDTPGALKPKNLLEKEMEKSLRRALDDADVVLYLVDATKPRHVPDVERSAARKPTVVALNKVDRLRKREDLLPLIADLSRRGPFREFLPISALKETNIDLLVRTVVALLPEGPPFYPPESLTQQPERFFVGELIREQIFLLYREEVPYATEVLIDDFKEREGRKDYIRATVIVESPSQKAILIGKDGRGAKTLGTASRDAIEDLLGRPVFLEIHVKVVPKWRKDPSVIRRLELS